MKRIRLILGVVVIAIVATLTSCSKGDNTKSQQSEATESKTPEAPKEEKKPVVGFSVSSGSIARPSAGASYDSVRIQYNIAWPVNGSEETVNALRSWIVSNVIGGTYTPGQTLADVLNNRLSQFDLTGEDSMEYRKEITLRSEPNTPFEGYAELNADSETYSWLANYTDYNSVGMIMRLSDHKVADVNLLSPKKAVKDTRKMTDLIVKYLEKEGKSSDKDWRWEENIQGCTPGDLPLPESPITFSKEGVVVNYIPGEISPSYCGGFGCTIPYDEVIPALSDEVVDFFGLNNIIAASVRKE